MTQKVHKRVTINFTFDFPCLLQNSVASQALLDVIKNANTTISKKGKQFLPVRTTAGYQCQKSPTLNGFPNQILTSNRTTPVEFESFGFSDFNFRSALFPLSWFHLFSTFVCIKTASKECCYRQRRSAVDLGIHSALQALL